MDLQLCVYAVVIAVDLAVGGRLLWRGRAAGCVPERLLGASLSLDGIEWLLWVVAYLPGIDGTGASDCLLFGYRICLVCHSIFLLAFTRCVFHPQSRAALALVVGAAAVMLGSLGVSAAHGDWSGYGNRGAWVWFETGTQQIGYAWTLLEAGLHHLQLRRRLRHGLGDPVVANRLALWALYGAGSLTAGVLYLVSLGVATPAGDYPFAIDVAMIVFTSVACGAIWLAFFPPVAYRRWAASRLAPTAD
jgi:hypothetical protein